MTIFLLTIILAIAFFMFCSAIIVLPEGINSDVITVTRIKLCAVLSAVLMIGCVFAISYIEKSPENVKAKIDFTYGVKE